MLEITQEGPSSPHDSARDHISGRSEYIDDRPPLPGELKVGLLYSPHAHAKIKRLDVNRARKIKGVHCILTGADCKADVWGSIICEQPFFAKQTTHYVGEVIAVIGAETEPLIQAAKEAIRIEFEALPAVLSLTEAIRTTRFIGDERRIERGDPDEQIDQAPHQLTGRLDIDGADHFYLENQAAIAYPLENQAIEVHSSTQHPSETQHLVAAALGLPYHQVVCQVKRLGGGFGGKETQAAPFAVYAAMVAQQCQRPARLVLSKDDDMIMTGKRNPYRVDYRVGFAADGRILGLTVNLFGNGGAFADLSPAILERAMAHVDNAYYLPAVRIRGRVYRTHVHPHTAFRGFGAPKGIATIEEIMDRIAAQLNVDPLAIRLKNVYRDEPHNRTPYGQVVDNNILPDLFETLAARCDYRSRRESIQTYNRNAGDYLRGIALTPVKFGIAFNTRFLNQANALVIIHQDGTLQVATGAVEMGQGVNSRIARLIADCFGLPIEQIRMMPTATDKNANTSATAASSGTDLNGAAALKACHSLKVRLGSLLQQLQPIPEDRWAQNIGGLGLCEDITVDPDFDANRVVFKDGLVFLVGAPEFRVSFAKLVKEAYFHRIALSAYGHHRTPNLSFNKLTGQGRAFQYFTQGAACSEVEVNCWTGAVKVLQTDILMDAGRPINYEIDYGQVAGAFIQGMGWLTTEALYYDEQGKLLSHSPSTYKIAGIHDTPRTFHIEFVKNDGNTNNVGRTKALGEPPLLLALSVWAAIRDAISGPQAERREKGLKKLSIPATAEVILRQLWPDSFAQWEGSHDHD